MEEEEGVESLGQWTGDGNQEQRRGKLGERDEGLWTRRRESVGSDRPSLPPSSSRATPGGPSLPRTTPSPRVGQFQVNSTSLVGDRTQGGGGWRGRVGEGSCGWAPGRSHRSTRRSVTCRFRDTQTSPRPLPPPVGVRVISPVVPGGGEA